MYNLSMKYITPLFFILLFFFNTSTVAIEMSEPEFRTAIHCDSREDYEISKQGALNISATRLTLDKQQIVIDAKIGASQCQQIRDNQFQWKHVSPTGRIRYEHHYAASNTQEIHTKSIIIDRKKVWMSAISPTFQIIGQGDVSGTMEKGFFARIVLPLTSVANEDELTAIESGKTQSLRVGLFLKALISYVSDGVASPYEESGGAGLYYIDFMVAPSKEGLTIQ